MRVPESEKAGLDKRSRGFRKDLSLGGRKGGMETKELQGSLGVWLGFSSVRILAKCGVESLE